VPVRNPAIRPLSDWEVDRSLGEDLIDVADDIRQLYTEFGLRPYRVFLVWVRYTADENADGIIDDGEDLITTPRSAPAGRCCWRRSSSSRRPAWVRSAAFVRPPRRSAAPRSAR
jgi:hypothetical protein